MVPDKLVIEPHCSEEVTISGFSATPGQAKQKLLCQVCPITHDWRLPSTHSRNLIFVLITVGRFELNRSCTGLPIILSLKSYSQALIGKGTNKEKVFKIDLMADFINPFLSFSEKSLAFTILKRPGTALEVLHSL